MRVRRVDLVASGLLSALLVCGSLVAVLAALWLMRPAQRPAGLAPISFETQQGGSGRVDSLRSEIQAPESHSLESRDFPFEIESVLEGAEAVALEATRSGAAIGAAGASLGDGQNDTSGTEAIPKTNHWVLKFQAESLDDYAAQLDFFGIELACIGSGVPTIDYAHTFAGAGGPVRRSGKSADESRLYFLWRDQNPLATYERRLLQRAGIATQGRLPLKLIPDSLRSQLAELEREHARQRDRQMDTIQKTVFRSVPGSSDTYQFEIVEIVFRQD